MYLEHCATERCVISSSYNHSECAAGAAAAARPKTSRFRKKANKNSRRNADDNEADDENSVGCTVSVFSKVELDQLPEDLLVLLPGFRRPLPNDYNAPPPPPWLDVQRVKKGQAFGLKYLHGLNYSQTLSLLLLFASIDGLKPLIYTEKSHTPSLAQKRYLSTVVRVKSWYETDICDSNSEGYKNLRKVRAMHISVSSRLNALTVDEVHRLADLEEKLKSTNGGDMLCPLLGTLKKDFSRPKNGPTYPVYERNEDRVYLNQLEMAFTQFGFFGLVLLYPHKFAAKPATKEELTNFVHMWRYIGYMLGIEDEYNLCSGDLETVKQRAGHLVEYFFKPVLLNVNKEWEHMSRCALQGIEKFTKLRINFESTLMYFYWVLGIETPSLTHHVGWKEMMLFNVTKYVMTESHKLPGFARFFNFIVKRNIERAAKEEYGEKH